MVNFFWKTRDWKHSSDCIYQRNFHKADSIELGLERCLKFFVEDLEKGCRNDCLKSGSENGECPGLTEG